MSTETSSAIQAICAAIALIFGIYAYNTWASQEAAKRNAEFALSLMKAGYEAQMCFDSMAASVIWRNFGKEDLEKIIVSGEEKAAGCAASFSQFEALVFVANSALDARTSQLASTYVIILKSRARRYQDLRATLRYSEKWKQKSKDANEITARQLILSNLEDLDALVFDLEAYSSDVKLKENAEAWNAEVKARQSENGGRARALKVAQSMNERLTQYVRLKVAH